MQDIGEKERRNMKNKNAYKKAPQNIANAIKFSEDIKDFLPPPEELVRKEEVIKITLNLNKESVKFFKEKSEKMGVPYQTMIKKVIDLYANNYK